MNHNPTGTIDETGNTRKRKPSPDPHRNARSAKRAAVVYHLRDMHDVITMVKEKPRYMCMTDAEIQALADAADLLEGA